VEIEYASSSWNRILVCRSAFDQITGMPSISYQVNSSLKLDEVIALYRASTLGERRPIDRREIMQAMMEQADLVVTAWQGEQLIGIARTLTDYAYVAYLADLAVHQHYQHRGIGRELIRRTEAELEPTCFITLLAAPKAQEYYGKVGFEPHPRAWVKAARAIVT